MIRSHPVTTTCLAPALFACITGWPPAALAGPPLATEDPGILDPGQWEFNPSASYASLGAGDIYELPALDLSLGVIQNQLQVSAGYRYVVADPDGQASKSDFGNPELGVKWRFLNTGTVQASLGATYSFGISRTLAEAGVGDDTDSLELPLALEYQLAPQVRCNGAISYISVEDETDSWTYSAAVAYTLSERWELLWELAAASDENFDDSLLDLRAGFDYTVTPNFHLLVSAATGLREAAPDEELNYDVYLGLQFFY